MNYIYFTDSDFKLGKYDVSLSIFHFKAYFLLILKNKKNQII